MPESRAITNTNKLGDIRKILKKKFNVIPGEKIKIYYRIRDDENKNVLDSTSATVVKLYPYVVQLRLPNGQYISPSYSRLYLMLHGVI